MPYRRNLAVALAAVLVAACGSRLDDATRLEAIQAGARRGQSTGTTQVATAGTATTLASGTTGGSAGTAGSAGSSGSAASQGGGGEATDSCTPSGASDVGITESEITLGEVGTITGPIPALGQTTINGVKAYLGYLNEIEGGVCGRQVRLITGDDRLDTGVNRSETARLASQVFGFVGGWAVTDDGGATVLQGTNIPDVGLAISDARIALANNFSPNPIEQGTSGATTVFRHLVSTYNVHTAAVVWGAQVSARNSALKFVADLQSLGVNVVVQREVAITETNYVPVAQQIANEHADLVVTALEITGISRLAQAFQQVGYRPPVPDYGAQTYGDRFIDLAGAEAAEGTIIGLTYPIVEEADSNPHAARFLEWYQRVNPGAEIDFFALLGWVSAVMFTDAIREAGPSPTRDSVLQVLGTYTNWDAGGMVAPINPAQKKGSNCFLIVTVHSGHWERVYPQGSGYGCG